MSHDPHTSEHVTDRLHPAVWIALVGFVIWFAIAIWSFGTGGYADWLLTVVTLFLLVAVSLPLILSRVGRSRTAARESLSDWARGEFQMWQDRAKASSAATEILLPIAAAAIGMTAIGIVFHYVTTHLPAVS
jgi:hypothetical protein